VKTVASVNWIHHADRIRMLLEAHGIEAFIPDEGMATANPLMGAAIGGIRVQVREEQYDEAIQLLKDLES
jgi:hypothetical protein